MSLLGEGAVAIWHDIAPEGRDEFYAWHGEEHMPERVGVPGFLRSTRYVTLAAKPEFFILHEALTFAVLASQDYQASLNRPTPRTLAISPYFRNAARSLCRVVASFGHGQAGLIATCRYGVTSDPEKHRETMTREIFSVLKKKSLVSGAHFLAGDASASALETAERRARGGNDAAPGWVLLVESAGDAETLQRFCNDDLAAIMRKQPGMIGLEHGLYRLQSTLSKPVAA